VVAGQQKQPGKGQSEQKSDIGRTINRQITCQPALQQRAQILQKGAGNRE
jgi:hypothetical protein